MSLLLALAACQDPHELPKDSNDSGEVAEMGRLLQVTLTALPATETVGGGPIEEVLPGLTGFFAEGSLKVIERGFTLAPSTTSAITARECGTEGRAPGSVAQTGRYDNRDLDTEAPAPECDRNVPNAVNEAGGTYRFLTSHAGYKNLNPYWVSNYDASIDVVNRCYEQTDGKCDRDNLNSGTDALAVAVEAEIDAGTNDIQAHYFPFHHGFWGGWQIVSSKEYENHADNALLQEAKAAYQDCLVKYPSPAVLDLNDLGERDNYVNGTKDPLKEMNRAVEDHLGELTFQDLAVLEQQARCAEAVNFTLLPYYLSDSKGNEYGILQYAWDHGYSVVVTNGQGETVPGANTVDGGRDYKKGHPVGLGQVDGHSAETNMYYFFRSQKRSDLSLHTQNQWMDAAMIPCIELPEFGLSCEEVFDDPRAMDPTDENYEDLRETVAGEPMTVNDEGTERPMTGSSVGMDTSNSVRADVPGLGVIVTGGSGTYGADEVWWQESDSGEGVVHYEGPYDASVTTPPAALEEALAKMQPGVEQSLEFIGE